MMNRYRKLQFPAQLFLGFFSGLLILANFLTGAEYFNPPQFSGTRNRVNIVRDPKCQMVGDSVKLEEELRLLGYEVNYIESDENNPTQAFISIEGPDYPKAVSPTDLNNQRGFPRNRINIITYKNGKGLERDFTILERELNKIGYQVYYANIYVQNPIPPAYINIFLESGSEYFFPFAQKNYLIPNPDWFLNGADLIKKFDLILCKTKEAERIFSQWNPNVKFISFTSQDVYDPRPIKNYKQNLHFASASAQRGTNIVENVWVRNPSFPLLCLLKFETSPQCMRHNIHMINGYAPTEQVRYLQNLCGIHLCPSETEGFGHIMFEAMSAEAVVVTTNAPPMNEFIHDPRCLVNYTGTGSAYLSTTYYADSDHLQKVISNLLKMPEEELRKMGQKNRQYFLENDAFFKSQIAEIFKIDGKAE